MAKSSRSANDPNQGNNIVMVFIVLLILAALLGGFLYYSSAQKNRSEPEPVPAEGMTQLPEEEVICGAVTVAENGETIRLRDADGTVWELLPTATVLIENLREFENERVCALVHPVDFPEEYGQMKLRVFALLEDTNAADEEIPDGDSNQDDPEADIREELTCGLIDIAADAKITLEETGGATWELLPEDGASANTLRAREGVRTCIAYDPLSPDQGDLDERQIHVTSAAMIRDAGEEELQ